MSSENETFAVETSLHLELCFSADFQGGFLLWSFHIFGLHEISIFLIVCFETIVIAWVYGK